jgi:transposase
VLIERILAHGACLAGSLTELQVEIAHDRGPVATAVALLPTIPGIGEQAATTIIAEIGTGRPLGVDAVPRGQPPGLVGGPLSGQPRERRVPSGRGASAAKRGRAIIG